LYVIQIYNFKSYSTFSLFIIIDSSYISIFIGSAENLIYVNHRFLVLTVNIETQLR